MSRKRITAVVVFLVGAIIATQADEWSPDSFWAWLLMFIVGVGICGKAVEMWRSETPKEDEPDEAD